MEPIYTPKNTNPAYQLNWGLTIFWREDPIDDDSWLEELQSATEPDGVRVLKHRSISGTASQFFVSTRPPVSPAELIRSVKGRLQHVVRDQRPKAFQRNYSLRSIGAGKRDVVEEYVEDQLGHHKMADPAVQQRLKRYQQSFPGVDLGCRVRGAHGEYWYNLHLVFVNEGRWMEIREWMLDVLQATMISVCKKYEYRLSAIALLADHNHLTLGCPIDQSPEHVALTFLNNCAYKVGMKPIFRFGYYVGTFGEYDRGAVL